MFTTKSARQNDLNTMLQNAAAPPCIYIRVFMFAGCYLFNRLSMICLRTGVV